MADLTKGIVLASMGAEYQSVPMEFPATISGGTNYLAINTTSPIDGTADFVWDKPNNGSASTGLYYRQAGVLSLTYGVQAGVVFTPIYSSGLASSTYVPMIGFHAFNYYQGLGWYNDGSNIKIALADGGTRRWTSSTSFTANTKEYDVMYYEHKRSNSTYDFASRVIIRDYSTHAIVEDSGWVNFTNSTIGFGDIAGVNIGSDFIYSAGIKFYIDNILLFTGNFFDYSRTKRLTPSTVGANDAWTLGAGSTKLDAIDDMPNDGDTSYIIRTATPTATQSFTVTATGYTLSGNEKVVGVGAGVHVKTYEEDTIAYDKTATNGYQTGVTTDTISITPANVNDRIGILKITIFNYSGSNGRTGTPTWGGVNMTQIGTSTNGAIRTELWYRLNTGVTAENVVSNFAASANILCEAHVLNGVYQTSGPGVTSVTGTGNPSQAITPNNNYGWLMDFYDTDDTAVTVGAGQTQRSNTSHAAGSSATSTEGPINPKTSTTIDWTAGTGNYVQMVLNIQPRNKGAVFASCLILESVLNVTSVANSFDYQPVLIEKMSSKTTDVTIGDVDAAEIGVRTSFSQSLDRRCTNIYGSYTYALENTVLTWYDGGALQANQAVNRSNTY